MYFCYDKGGVTLANGTSQQTYYQSEYEGLILEDFSALEKWIEEWCAGTGAKERKEILEFSAAGRVHQKYREGDFFRFRINRSLYGYGRILLDFNKMRKEKAPFWDIFMGKPICAAVYHIVTERKDVRPEELAGLAMLPSQMVMDNNFFYGEYVIIGNQPVPEDCQNYPIHYGNTIRAFDTGIRYQCGKTFIAREDKQALYSQYRNNGIGWNLKIKLSVLQKCIEANSNQPYWDEDRQPDLRNPRFHEHLREIQEQIGING